MAQSSEIKLLKRFDQNVEITGNLTIGGSVSGISTDNFYLDGITKSGNTLTFSVNGATNQTYTFGSNAFTSYTDHSTQGYLTSSSTINADTVDGYHASNLWRSDGATWNPSANVTLNQSANSQEWSFDINRNGHSGGYWQVWDSSLQTMLKVDPNNGKVYAPYNFVGNLEGNASTAGTADSAGYSSYLYRYDNRTISPSEYPAGRMSFGFTSFNNNNTAPWADFIHLRGYTDNSGGNDNLLVFSKSSPAMRIYSQTYGSSTAYSNYVDVITTGNIGSQSVSYATNAGTLDGIDSSQFIRSDASDTATGQYTFSNKRHYFGASTNWDSVSSASQTNVHFQGHDYFWIGAGNGTWYTGTANSGLPTGALSAHDLLISTMQSSADTYRGITFATDNTGNQNSGWRLGKWFSGENQAQSRLIVDGQIFAKAGNTDEQDFYGNHYDTYRGTAGWPGDTSAGWHTPSIVASSALQIQSGTSATNSRKPQIQFHQYGYGGPAIEYDGPNKTLWIGDINSSSGDRLNYVKFRMGNVNKGLYMNHDQIWREEGPLHLQHTSGHNTYINCSAGGNVGIGADSAADKLEVHGNVRANAFYDTNTAYYVNPDGTSNLYNLELSGYKHTYLYINPGNGREAMVRFNGGSGSTWYIGSRTTTQLLGSQDAYHVYSQTTSQTVGGYDTAGNHYARSSVRTPVFYDSNNTDYYVDPDGSNVSIKVKGEISNSNYATGALQQGALNIGRIDTNYAGITTWASDVRFGILANCSNDWEFGIHDSGTSVESVFVYNNSGGSITMGRDVGWGTTPIIAANSFRAPIFYDSNDTGYYVDPTSDSLISGTLNISGNTGGSSYGNQLVLGQSSKSLPYTAQDTNARTIIYATGKYPVLTLNHTVTTNANHGPTIQFTHNGTNSNAQWVAGTNGTGSQFQIGYSNSSLGNGNFNPHHGIAGYNGITALHIDDSSRIGIGHAGDWGGLGGGNPVANIHLKAPQTYSSYGAYHSTVIQSTQNGGGLNGAGLLVVNDNGNHSWGICAEFRVNNNTIGADRSSISFTTAAYSGQSWSIGYAHNSGSNFRIKRDHGWVSQSWGTTLMEMDRNGNVTFTGDVVAYSDERLKKDIKTIENPLDTVKQLRGVTYKLKENDKESIGLIAQEVEKVLPQVVLETEGDVDAEFAPKGVAYGNIVGVLIEAIKEQQKQIDELKKLINP